MLYSTGRLFCSEKNYRRAFSKRAVLCLQFSERYLSFRSSVDIALQRLATREALRYNQSQVNSKASQQVISFREKVNFSLRQIALKEAVTGKDRPENGHVYLNLYTTASVIS